MRVGRALIAAVAVVAGAAAMPAARAAEPAVIATAGFGIVGDAHHGYVASFTVRRNFASSLVLTDMVSEVFDCSFDTMECTLVAQQIDNLPAGAFALRADGTASLRTSKPTVVYVGPNHEEALVNYRGINANATTSALLGGTRRCVDGLAGVGSADAGVAQDVTARTSGLPRAETIRGLARSRGRCYIEATSSRLLQTVRSTARR
jgi:hypothetical protein